MFWIPFLSFSSTGDSGAAISTVPFQCVSVGMFLSISFFGQKQLKLKLHHFIPNWRIIGEILLIGLPSFLQLASQSLTIVGYQ